MSAEFEEKEFECAFNRQLGVLGFNFWCPGQFLEASVGFDGAALIDDPFIFRFFMPWSSLRQEGLTLDPELVQAVFGTGIDHTLPPFRFNFFAQHKRPEYRDKPGRLKKEWAQWNAPYFRYKVDNQQQQEILARLEKYAGESALVLYSCAAFHTKRELWEYIASETIVQNTNFTKPSELKNHHVYTFNKPGATGKAFSKMEEIYGKSFEELIADRRNSSNEPKQAAELVISAGETIKKVFNELSESKKHHINIVLAQEIASKLSSKKTEDSATARLTEALANILVLRFVYGTSLILMS